MNNNFYCVIMAGGVGSRFWPLSRNEMPKQFLDILGVGRTFIQQTFDRFASFIPVENILVVTFVQYKDLVAEQLPQMLEKNILLEPFRRNTAPCIAYASYWIKEKNPNATMVVAPSDHFISNEILFVDTIKRGMDIATAQDRLFTIGVPPTRPETAYGYIQVSVAEAKSEDGISVMPVKTFTEKPNKEMAEVLVNSGEFLWNSGVFIWNVKTIISQMEQWLPEVSTLFEKGAGLYCTSKEKEFITAVYQDSISISVDYGVMEKTSIASVIQAPFGWSDLGTWHSLYLHYDKDENNNLIMCDELMMDKVKDSIVITTNKGKLMAVKGLDNFMVVDTKDVLMICPKDEVRFKNLITDLSVYEKTKFQ